jgi:quercetin dioxygenase-like cupin family protein
MLIHFIAIARFPYTLCINMPHLFLFRKKGKRMKYTIVYSDQTGKSHFKDNEIEFIKTPNTDSQQAEISKPTFATKIFFTKMPKGWHKDWYTIEKKQFFCVLEGQIEVTVGDGEKRVFGQGDILFFEDINGMGHQVRVVGETDFMAASIPLFENKKN